jgi:hypothetical protein
MDRSDRTDGLGIVMVMFFMVACLHEVEGFA